MRSDVSERAIGRWYGILSALGVSSKFLRNRHGPCPKCEGRDRFRWDNKDGKGTFYCSNCGSGDGFRLLMNVNGYGFKEAMRDVESVVDGVKASAVPRVRSDAECISDMRRKWRSSDDLSGPAAAYLKRRLGQSVNSPALRSDRIRPALIARMQAPDGKGTMIHQTLLTEDGRVAPTDRPKLMMPGTIADGAAVRLAEFIDEIGIAEGIETALSATILTGVPCWAALNEVMLQKWIAPKGVARVVIFGDNDLNFVGQSAAYMLARKISLRKEPPSVDVRIPEKAGDDWNDVLQAKFG